MTAKARLLDKMVDALCKECVRMDEELAEESGHKVAPANEWRQLACGIAEGVR